MKAYATALLALPALLCSIVVAIPPPAAYEQHPFHVFHPEQPPRLSRWRSFSHALIDSLFTGERSHPEGSRPAKDQHPPPHTFARYGGDLVVRFNISTHEEAASLAEAADTLMLDVWEYSQNWCDIRLSKDSVPLLLGLLPESLQNAHAPLLREQALAQAILDSYRKHPPQSATESPSHLPSRRPFAPDLERSSSAETNIFFADYQPLSVIEPWLRLLASLFTTHVTYINVGISYEGRNIPGLRVGVHPTNNEDPSQPKRKTILVVGSLHAREWISTTTVNYVAYSLITGYGKLQGITHLLENFDFVFVPVLNPDGYVYTWETDRLWRKNRQQTGIRFCPGIDLDRAFGFEWSAADNPCSESFAGDTPFEAVEANAFAEWAKNETENNNVEFVGFLDLHSYSQEILYPYSYSCSDTPPGLENLEEVAYGLGKAIRITHGHAYEIMPACEGNIAYTGKSGASDKHKHKQHLTPRMELSGGSALDFFYHAMDVRYAYQIKLRDRGSYGFLLPRENIIPTGKEILNAVLYFGGFLGEFYDRDERREVELSLSDPESYRAAEDRSAQGDETDLSRSVAGDEATDSVHDEADAWVVVEDLVLDPAEISWELRRRRKR